MQEKCCFPLFNRACSIITNKDDLTKESGRIKQVLKENGYQESIISKIFKRITNNHSLSQPQQQTQATDIQEEEIRMSINLQYVEGIGKKQRRELKSHKIKSIFYTKSYCEAVYFGKSKRSDEHKISARKHDCENNEIAKHCWKAQFTTLAGIRRKLLIRKAG